MRHVTPKDPFTPAPDPLPHFAPFFLDADLRKDWGFVNARRAESGDLFAPPDTGFHHNPMESDVSYLYVASSPNFPGEVKIGMSKSRPDGRLKDAGSDQAFRKDPGVRISAYVMMKNVRAVQVESAVHRLLSGWRSELRIMGEKEWFTARPAEAMSAIELAARHYGDPKRVRQLADLLASGEDLGRMNVLDDLAPEFLCPGTMCLESPHAALFPGLPGASYERPSRLDERTERTDVVFVPISPPPDRYLWEQAYGLIPLSTELRGEDVTDLFPNIPRGYFRSLDVSVPDHHPFLRNRFVPGAVSGDGKIDISFSLRGERTWQIDRSARRLYETDLVRCPLMGRITELYWELRDPLNAALPRPDDLSDRLAESCRTKYLHFLSSCLVAARPEDITPRHAQYLHSSAMGMAGTPPGMAVCPVELCETVRPVLERSGWAAERSAPVIGPEAA